MNDEYVIKLEELLASNVPFCEKVAYQHALNLYYSCLNANKSH